MQSEQLLKLVAPLSILFVIFLVVHHFFVAPPRGDQARDNKITPARCNALYQAKKSQYRGETTTQSSVTYHKELNTCLTANLIGDSSTNDYQVELIDLRDDSILLSYESIGSGSYYRDGERVVCDEMLQIYTYRDDGGTFQTVQGCDRQERVEDMQARVRGYGFVMGE